VMITASGILRLAVRGPMVIGSRLVLDECG
jgi:hypothetical protein